VPGEEIENIRSLLAHAYEQEQAGANPSTGRDLPPTGSVHDEVERLRFLLAHVHDPEKMNPFRKLVLRITQRFMPSIRQPNQGKNTRAA
jgi:hypothetical protein